MKLGFLRARTQKDKGRKGVSAIEFALIAPVFFLLLIGVVEMSLILLAEHLLENATFNASRVAKTGYIAAGKTQLETVQEVLFKRLSGLDPLIDPNRVTVSYTSYGNLSDIGQPEQGIESLGAPSEVVVYVVSFPWKIFTPMMTQAFGDDNGEIVLTSRIVVRNEPYD